MSRPSDAAAFIAVAEQATNEYREMAAHDLFAPQARWVTVTDGARTTSVGADAIHRTWALTCKTFKIRHFQVRKWVVAATADTIVNEWSGGPRGREKCHGIEIWRFDGEGRVDELYSYSFLNLRFPAHPVQVLKLAVGSPATAYAAARAAIQQLRAHRRQQPRNGRVHCSVPQPPTPITPPRTGVRTQ